MQDYTIKLLLGYIYNRFALVFLICLLGSFINDLYSTYNSLTKFNIKKILLSSISASIIVCAISEYIYLKFGVYIFFCFVCGLWSYKILEYLTNWNFVSKIFSIILKSMKKEIAIKLANAVNDLEQLEKQNNKSKIENEKKEKDSG